MFQGPTANVRNVSILKTLKIDGSLKWAPSMEALGSILEMKPKPKQFATGNKQDSSPGGRGTGGIYFTHPVPLPPLGGAVTSTATW